MNVHAREGALLWQEKVSRIVIDTLRLLRKDGLLAPLVLFSNLDPLQNATAVPPRVRMLARWK
jgi:hypothetical protein